LKHKKLISKVFVGGFAVFLLWMFYPGLAYLYYTIDHYDLDHPVKPSAQMKKRYPVALQRYPSLEKCREAGFAPEKHTLTSPPKIFWTRGEFNVCYYWHLHSVDDPIKELDRLADGIGSIAKKRAVPARIGREKIGPFISITWSFRKHPTPYGWNFIHRGLEKLITRAAGFRVMLSQKNKIEFVILNTALF